ncbi:acetyl/propionyl/methylcrotonyl-CoA carboxylase subunit alpha [Amycolatopsis rifamycinica]|uniref:biotin carboxylase n=1 Tax=Amycolatopsis rifamycinica TaxID=287986 RepID=A0A066U3X3_9PSEU|nr:biotin carboxylase N-terminal domain-containing protein [Amycolatopsis rifamycinica]KDN21780.1 carbamoyl-phosphate synthase subunit L [Amycolatopsis rifamycinica]
MPKRVLIANRGEIARRIARTCRRLDVDHVAVHSAADAGAAHLDGAIETVHIGPGPAGESYLDIDAVVEAALRTDCDAVHPGYGFLSENPEFAARVTEAGLTYIGPDAATIEAMGDKARARDLMAAAGVPVLPGSEQATESADVLLADARRIGYPVILKPVAGGGGKGMRVVHGEAELSAAVEEAVRLGRAGFGDGRLLAERYVAAPRHIEVQVFGDRHGNVVHLLERECSLQRRHQKIVEEAPAPHLSATTRHALLDAAVRGATALGYVGAGTFEFILDGDGRFFFLEVNTRLQVEHPVTEEITGLDLVEWQLLVADGEPLPLPQWQIRATGHAIECRVYAEDPEHGFRPAPGRAEVVRWPREVRVEAAFDGSGDVPGFYDPMVAKLVATGADRPTALARLRAAVEETTVVGLTTNLGFLADLLAEPRVADGRVDTHLVDAFTARPVPHRRDAQALACAAAMAVPDRAVAASPWTGTIGAFDRAALDPEAPLGRVVLRHDGRDREARLLARDRAGLHVEIGGGRFTVLAERGADGLFHGTAGTSRWTGLPTADGYEIVVGGHRVALARRTFDEGGGETSDSAVRTPMPGVVVGVACEPGARVEAGELLVVVEAMKMENRILAPWAGTVERLSCAPGDGVTADQVLVTLKAEGETHV